MYSDATYGAIWETYNEQESANEIYTYMCISYVCVCVCVYGCERKATVSVEINFILRIGEFFMK